MRKEWTTTDCNRVRDLVATGLSASDIGRIVGRSKASITNGVAKHGLGPWLSTSGIDREPAPADFATVANGMSIIEAADHYGVGRKKIVRWRKETGVEPIKACRPVPDGFAATARVMAARSLRVHFSASKLTVERWAAECGVELINRSPHRRALHSYGTSPTPAIKRDDSPAGRAVDECLRRLAPTYRCDDTGRANPKGSYWRHGRVVLSDAEVIARAERKGWSADAWRALAA